MSLGDPVSVTYNGVAKSLARVNSGDAYSSVYYLDDTTQKYTLTVKHTIPPKGGTGESHMIRLDVDYYDAEGELTRSASAWTVIKTFVGSQLASASDYTTQALVDFLTDGNIDKLIARES